MLISPNRLAETATVLRSGQLDLLAYVDEICNRIDAADLLIVCITDTIKMAI
jgi:hypothetical protein